MNLDKRLLRKAHESRVMFAVTIGFGFLAGVLTVAQAGFLSRVIALVYLAGQSLDQVADLLVLLLGVIVVRAVLAWGIEVAANTVAVRVKTDLREQLYQHIMALGPAYTQGERTGELNSVVVEGIEALDAYFSQYLPQLVLAALVPFTFLVFIFPLDFLSGLILLVTAPLIPLFMTLIGSAAQSLTRKQWGVLSRMSAYFLDVLQGLTTLKILGRSRAQIQVIAQVSDRFRLTTMSVLRVTFLSAFVLEMVATLSTAIVAVEIGLRLLYGRLVFEQALFVLLLTPEFYLPLRLLGTRFHAGMAGVAAAKRIFEILETPVPKTPVRHKPGDTALPSQSVTPELMPGELIFRNVFFAYDDQRTGLKDVSFRMPVGQLTALVGPSGGGKSTLASLLLRFIQPDQGQINVDEQPLDVYAAEDWRALIAWVPQNPYLFYGTVGDNIRLAYPDVDTEQVIWAAQQSYAHDFIQELPQGYDTLIGERGARLSGGQAQRIALARAFLKNAPIVILDEATANLDPEHELLIQQAMARLLEGRTALVIAHRLNTVVEADQIIVLDSGQVVETGTHTALARQGGLYKRLIGAYTDVGQEMISERPLPEGEAMRVDYNDLALSPSDVPADTLESSLSASQPSASTFIRLVKLMAPLKGWVALSALMGVATIASGVGLMVTSAYIISAAALAPSIAELQLSIVGVRFFGISRGVFRYLERYLSHQVTFRLLARLRVWFYQALEPLAPARLMGYRSADLLSRIMGDIESLESFYVRVLAPPLVAIVIALGVGAFLAGFDLRLAWTLWICMLIAGLSVPLLTRLLGRSPGRRLVEARADLSLTLVDGIQGMSDLVAFDQGPRQIARIQSNSQDLGLLQRRMARISGLQTALMLLLANLAMWAVIMLAIPLVASGQIDGVYLAVLGLVALTSFEAVNPLPLAAQYLESNLRAAQRLFQILDTSPEVQDLPDPLSLPSDFNLRVENLRFRYPSTVEPGRSSSAIRDKKTPGDGAWVLDDLSFDLPHGKRLAIVGPSGAGKSTLVNLLLRFWDYDEGSIWLGANELHRYRQDDVRQIMGVVAQNAYLFSASVRDNLRIANPKASQAEIDRAAQGAQILGFIQSLPQGYDTWIGEQGVRLSAGERQRIAIARALLKAPPLLILDEATANLDAITERRVFEALQTLMRGQSGLMGGQSGLIGGQSGLIGGQSVLMITHRLVGMETMDEILILEKGRVVERGRHEELLEVGGMYRRMWDLQNQSLALQ